MGEVCLGLETVAHLVHFAEAWWAQDLRLRNSLALLTVDDDCGHVYVIDVRSVGHCGLVQLRAHQEDSTVRERNQTLQFFKSSL